MAYSQAQKDHYEKNKQAYIARAKAGRDKRVAYVLSQKEGKACVDCKQEWHPAVLHFHHIDPSTKIDGVSRIMRNRGMQALIDEIAKCELVCANCHTLRHVIDDSIGANVV